VAVCCRDQPGFMKPVPITPKLGTALLLFPLDSVSTRFQIRRLFPGYRNQFFPVLVGGRLCRSSTPPTSTYTHSGVIPSRSSHSSRFWKGERFNRNRSGTSSPFKAGDAAWPRSSCWGADLSHHSPDCLVADAEFCCEGTQTSSCHKRADGRFLLGGQLASTRTVAWSFAGFAPRWPTRSLRESYPQIGERNAR
jgi:hypothetical protein